MKKKYREEFVRKIPSLRDMVVNSAKAYGNKDLYVYKENKQEIHYSYNNLKSDCECFGTAIHALEPGGAHIAVIGETSAKITVTYLATVASGSVIVPLDKELQHDQIVNFLCRAECSAVVYSPTFNGVITEQADKLPGVRYFIPMGSGEVGDEYLSKGQKIMQFSEVIALGKQLIENGDDSYYSYKPNLEKLCAILFTSGTTGTSKGVMLCERNLCSAAYACCLTTPYDETTRLVSVLPQHHTYEMTTVHIAGINIGVSTFINDSLKYVMRNFAAYKPNALILVPLFVETIHKRIRDEIRKKDMEKKVSFAKKMANAALKVGVDVRGKLFSQITGALGGEVTSIICGGAPVSADILKDFYSYGITIYEGYGITECAPLIACNPPGKKPKFGSCGKPVFGVRARIDKANPADTTGEIVVKGDNVMMGYYKNEEATAEVFTEDGWFKTGDIGYIDNEGFIYITGRKKNVIILSNGKNVFPEELEEHLSHNELIKESVVLGRTDEAGEIAITALIYPDYDRLVGKTGEEIEAIIRDTVNDVNRTLPTFKHMTEVCVMKEEFEKTSSKKIKRFLYK